MVFQTILKYIPLSDNGKVALGVGFVLSISYATLSNKGV